MYLKSINTRNIQNHRDVKIELPEKGLIVFTGDNSNGKSVIVKATRYIISGLLTKPRKRAALVNRNATFGEVIYTRSDGCVLTAHITREAASTYVKLEVPGCDPIVRYLADKNYTKLTEAFGWHYDVDSGISLNIAEAEESLLFYKTSNRINARLLESAATDSVANVAAVNIEQAIKETRTLRDAWVNQIRSITETIKDLKTEDIQPLEEQRNKLAYYLNILSRVYIPNLPVIEAVPNISYVDVHIPQLPNVKYPKIYNLSCTIPDILPIAKELETLRNNVCPTCGRGFDCES